VRWSWTAALSLIVVRKISDPSIEQSSQSRW
jgi:hypothetical protein